MINFLRGILISIEKESIVLDVNGFGIEVYPTKALLSKAVEGKELKCPAYMQISDAGLAMFGFADVIERDFFLELIQIKTIGGKMASKLMRCLDLQQIISAVKSDNVKAICVPGLGMSKASRICFEMKGKIEKKFAGITDGEQFALDGEFDAFVSDALTGLGFTHGEAAKAIAMAKASNDDVKWSEESLLKAALGILQRR